MTYPDDKRGSDPSTGVRLTSFCLGLGIVLDGMEEAKASSEMFHRILNDLVGMEQRSLLVFEDLGNSGAACAREVPVASDAPLRTLLAQHCQPSALGICLYLASANPLWCQSTHCVPGLCQVPCGECGGKTWSL